MPPAETRGQQNSGGSEVHGCRWVCGIRPRYVRPGGPRAPTVYIDSCQGLHRRYGSQACRYSQRSKNPVAARSCPGMQADAVLAALSVRRMCAELAAKSRGPAGWWEMSRRQTRRRVQPDGGVDCRSGKWASGLSGRIPRDCQSPAKTRTNLRDIEADRLGEDLMGSTAVCRCVSGGIFT